MVDIFFNFNLAAKVRGYSENVNWNWKEEVQNVQEVEKFQEVYKFYRR